MAHTKPELHFVLIPLMAPGHLLPMIDMARLLARRNVKVTIVTTPLNAARVKANINKDIQQGSPIHFQLIQFPNSGSGIPEGYESVDTLPSMDLQVNFFKALCLLHQPLEELFEKLNPTPDCIISDRHILPAADVARKFQVPRIIFDGTNCFFLLCNHCLYDSKAYENATSDSEPFVVPGLPDRIEFKRYQLPGSFNPNVVVNQGLNVAREMVRKSGEDAFGVVVNTFQELEEKYAKEYVKVSGKKVWCVGPVSLSNEDNMDKAQRCMGESNYEEGGHTHYYMKWLDSWPERSVIYVCLGSLNQVTPQQLMELGLGLEATKRPFIWVVRGAYKREETERLLLDDGLEERVKGRGVLIRGWAPQVLILSHVAIGAFITHCGWNSTLEGTCSGVPLITFPLFAEQFYNEKIVVQVVKTGVSVGCERVVHLGDEEMFSEIQVRRGQVKEAVEKVMGEDEEGKRIRERAKEYAEKAKKAVEKGGSSFLDMSMLIEDITRVKMLKMNSGEAMTRHD